MGEKKKKKKNVEGEKKKEEMNPITVVLNVDMNCPGCANKIIKCAKSFQGVETVSAEHQASKLTVIGKVDPSELRKKLQQKAKKKVDLVSPRPKKLEKDKDSEQDGILKTKSDRKPVDKKPKEKERPVMTAVLKVGLHCQGCSDKIHRMISKIKGVQELSIDKPKELVTVKGTMDPKALSNTLTEKLKRPVEMVIVPPNKDNKDKNKDSDGNTKDGGRNGDGRKKNGGEDGGREEDAGIKLEANGMEYMVTAPEYGYGYGYGAGYGYGLGGLVGERLHAPQMLSDENPYACSVM